MWKTLLRVVVPAGFSPDVIGDDWYLKLCEDGMVALLGQERLQVPRPLRWRTFRCGMGCSVLLLYVKLPIAVP